MQEKIIFNNVDIEFSQFIEFVNKLSINITKIEQTPASLENVLLDIKKANYVKVNNKTKNKRRKKENRKKTTKQASHKKE